jgi:hypothetical protein
LACAHICLFLSSVQNGMPSRFSIPLLVPFIYVNCPFLLILHIYVLQAIYLISSYANQLQ